MSIDRALRMYFVQGRRPNRAQNILISRSKHLYLLKDEKLKYQKSVLDPRTSGSKRLLYTLLALDQDTGVYYAELHPQETYNDLAGFLTRAWSSKYLHPMQGVPDEVNLPRIAYEDKNINADIQKAIELCRFCPGHLPGGFAAGIRLLAVYEQRILESRWTVDPEPRDISLDLAQGLSGICSAQSANYTAEAWQRLKQTLRPIPAEWISYVNALYDSPDGWRSGMWEYVLNGPRSSTRVPQ